MKEITLKLPDSLDYYHDDLERFFEGMLWKLEKNAKKGEALSDDQLRLLARMQGEIGELVEQMAEDDTHPNALYETYDIANFCFLMFHSFLDRGTIYIDKRWWKKR